MESLIHLRNVGAIPMPVQLALQLNDGSTQRLNLPVEIWFEGDRFTAVVPGPQKVTGVMVDPDDLYPDVGRNNNGGRRPRARPSAPRRSPPA